MSITEGIMALVNEIKSTEEFAEFMIARANINKYPELKHEIEILNKEQAALLKSNKSKKEIDEKTKEINRQFLRMCKHPEIGRMIKAGENFSRLMRDTYLNICKMLDSEL